MEEEKKYSEQFLRQRKMMLMLPLVMVPMMVLAFYGLGGGKGNKDGTAANTEKKGVNMTLPQAHIDSSGKTMDKMGYYKKAALDSLRYREKSKQDPYAVDKTPAPVLGSRKTAALPGGRLLIPSGSMDAQADDVLKQLDGLRKALAGSSPASGGRDKGLVVPQSDAEGGDRPSERLRALMEGTRTGAGPASHNDPEMERIDGMLDKLLRVQHPERGIRDTEIAPAAGPVVRAGGPGREGATSDFGWGHEDAAGAGSGFMEIGEKEDAADSARENVIVAVVNGDQTLTVGATVALRLEQEVTINGTGIPGNQLLYGVASLSGERLTVHVSSIRVGQAIVPVSLDVYDLDGLAGIRVPGAISRDVSKASADEALSGLGLASLDPSLGAQAASAGFQFAKSLASRKVRLVRVTVPAGYRVLLKNTKSITH